MLAHKPKKAQLYLPRPHLPDCRALHAFTAPSATVSAAPHIIPAEMDAVNTSRHRLDSVRVRSTLG